MLHYITIHAKIKGLKAYPYGNGKTYQLYKKQLISNKVTGYFVLSKIGGKYLIEKMWY